MKRTALITGATGGLGKAFAGVFANNGFDLVLSGRNMEELEKTAKELTEKHGTKVLTVASDLAEDGGADRLFGKTVEKGIAVDVLVNNAGFADFGLFAGCDPKKQQEMIEVNVAALVRLTRLFLPGMLERGEGRILNVASLAAFQPGPLMACYYASKAFVLSFSVALSAETEGTGVTVTALCPGTMKTGFEKHASMAGKSMLFSSMKPIEARSVAEYGYRSLMRGKTIAVHGRKNRLLVFLTGIAPKRMSAKAVMRYQRPVA